MTRRDRRLDLALGLGALGLVIAPWYRLDTGLFSTRWLSSYPLETSAAPALVQAAQHGRWWLWIFAACLLLAAAIRLADPRRRSSLLITAGIAGLALLLLQGFAVGYKGWAWAFVEEAMGPLGAGQPGMGWGAGLLATSFLLLFSFGLAERGVLKGDAFVIGSVTILVALVSAFVFYPVGKVLIGAFQATDGSVSASAFWHSFSHASIWSLDCVAGPRRCGVAWNTLALAIATGAGSTLLGLAFALVATRTRFAFKRSLKLLTILPIITPPFVVGLALILLFGRAGVVTVWVSDLLGIAPGRWLYGYVGIWLAQVLSFTPIAFLVLIGVVDGISPAMEEAAQTLKADRWRTFWTVSVPLMRPGLANAFLIGFIESLADFGNPLILGSNSNVLSTEIYFAVIGAQHDPGKAAVLALVLLSFTLGAFIAQRLWLGGKSFTTVTGKGDSGRHIALSPAVGLVCKAVVVAWSAFTLLVYAMILFGGFVKTWGRDHTLTLEHYAKAFSFEWDNGALLWTGVAWNSFWTTMQIALTAAPLTAALGLLTAYIIVRQRFVGRGAFEFALMMSFAIPGTIIGVSYLLAFNLPPIEITGTALILIICFVFRNMPVGVRSGIAAMSQIDKSLDEASLTLRANTFSTARRVIMPLLRPAIMSALVYSFVRSITSVSAVVFLVSAQYSMATAYILGLVENSGGYGVAIAYSSALIVVMILVIAVFQLLVGERRLRRENRIAGPPGATPVAALMKEMPA